MELDTKSISILNKPRKTVTSPRLLTINHERQKPLFCPKTLARQALEPQVFRPESLLRCTAFSTFIPGGKYGRVLLHNTAKIKR